MEDQNNYQDQQPPREPVTPTVPSASIPEAPSSPQGAVFYGGPPQPPRKSWKWRIIFIVLIAISLVTIAIPLVLLWLLSIQASHGVSGTEFIGILLYPLLLAGFIVAIVDIIFSAIYLGKHHPTGLRKVAAIAFIILAFVYLGYGVYSTV